MLRRRFRISNDISYLSVLSWIFFFLIYLACLMYARRRERYRRELEWNRVEVKVTWIAVSQSSHIVYARWHPPWSEQLYAEEANWFYFKLPQFFSLAASSYFSLALSRFVAAISFRISYICAWVFVIFCSRKKKQIEIFDNPLKTAVFQIFCIASQHSSNQEAQTHSKRLEKLKILNRKTSHVACSRKLFSMLSNFQN